MRKGVTYYDSAAKTGCENEALIWVTLNDNSKLVFPNFSQLIKMEKEKTEEGKVILDFSELKRVLDANNSEIKSVEIFLNSASVEIKKETILENVAISDI